VAHDALEHLERRRLLLVEALCAVARAEALEEVAERALDHRDLLGQELYLRFLLREGRCREVQLAGDLGVRVREGFEVGGEGVCVHGRGLGGDSRAATSPEALRRGLAEREGHDGDCSRNAALEDTDAKGGGQHLGRGEVPCGATTRLPGRDGQEQPPPPPPAAKHSGICLDKGKGKGEARPGEVSRVQAAGRTRLL
jgi:hypothetical protein